MNADDLLDFGLGLAQEVVGGLIVAAILGVLSFVIKPIRDKFWKPIWRALRWVTTIRITTTKRLAAKDSVIAELRGEVDEAHAMTYTAAAAARETGLEQGRVNALEEMKATPAPFLVQPNWRVVRMLGGYNLRNTQPGVQVSDVSISAPVSTFVLTGQTQWPGVFPYDATFQGRLVGVGRAHGATASVRWRDSNGEMKRADVFIDKGATSGGF